MKKMKKLAALLLALAMTLALCACGQQAGTPSAGPSDPAQTTPASDPTSEPSQGGEPAGFTTIQEGKLVMSTNAAFPPYEMTSDGEGYKGTGYEGIDVEVAGAIAEKLGLELVIDDMGFDPALLAVQEGQSDIAMADSPARKAYLRGKLSQKIETRKQMAMLARVGSPAALEMSERALLDMEDDE